MGFMTLITTGYCLKVVKKRGLLIPLSHIGEMRNHKVITL